jgi:hypothetical protein
MLTYARQRGVVVTGAMEWSLAGSAGSSLIDPWVYPSRLCLLFLFFGIVNSEYVSVKVLTNLI